MKRNNKCYNIVENNKAEDLGCINCENSEWRDNLIVEYLYV